MQPFVILYSIQLLCPQGCAVPYLLETMWLVFWIPLSMWFAWVDYISATSM
jgi:hypothetical protein